MSMVTRMAKMKLTRLKSKTAAKFAALYAAINVEKGAEKSAEESDDSGGNAGLCEKFAKLGGDSSNLRHFNYF